MGRGGRRCELPAAGCRAAGAISLVALVAGVGVLATFLERAPSHPADPIAATTNTETASPADTGAATVFPAAPATAPATAATPPPSAQSQSPGNATTPAAPPPLPAAASFEIAANDDSITVRSANLGADLYRLTLAAHPDPITPKVTTTGTNLRLTLDKDPDTEAPPMTLTLNSAVRWSLKLSAGNIETTADLTQSKLAALELAGGAHVFTLSPPPSAGTQSIRITHGMNQLKIKTNGFPVRLNLRTGAGKVILDGDTRTDTKPGSVLTSTGWQSATNRVDVDSIEGVGILTVDTN